MSFADLQLDKNLLRAVGACGFTQPTDIQCKAIPSILTGRDLMASAQTGTGKTAAFVLPVLQRLLAPPKAAGIGPRVLILTPTRELAIQVSNNIRQLTQFTRFVAGNVIGGDPYPKQIRMLKNPLDLLVATPGRLMDHHNARRLDMSRLEVFVLDEADRMLDMGFIEDIKSIAKTLPRERQTLLFSATLDGDIAGISASLLRNPARIQLAHNHHKHKSITQQLHLADDISHKHRLLSHFLNNAALQQAVIFTATKRSADTLARHLIKDGYPADALHGDMKQYMRKRTIDKMRRGKLRLLVATDVAARGLDIKGISHVINFDMPNLAEDYIHRIGRTGRGGASGTAISLVGIDDKSKLSNIEKLVGRKLQLDIVPGLEPRKKLKSAQATGKTNGKQRQRKPWHGSKRNTEIKYKSSKRKAARPAVSARP